MYQCIILYSTYPWIIIRKGPEKRECRTTILLKNRPPPRPPCCNPSAHHSILCRSPQSCRAQSWRSATQYCPPALVPSPGSKTSLTSRSSFSKMDWRCHQFPSDSLAWRDVVGRRCQADAGADDARRRRRRRRRYGRWQSRRGDAELHVGEQTVGNLVGGL